MYFGRVTGEVALGFRTIPSLPITTYVFLDGDGQGK